MSKPSGITALKVGDAFLLDFGAENVNTRVYHVRAIVDGEYFVLRTWSRKWGGHWAYTVEHQGWVETMAAHIRVRPARARDAEAEGAAAPDLLDALHSLLNIEGAALAGAPPGLDVPWHFAKARAAIAKAERREQP